MGNFIKQTCASLLGSLLGLFIFFGIGTTGLFLLIFAAASSKDTGPIVKNNSFLVFDLSTKITEGAPSSGQILQEAISGNVQERISLRVLLDTINKGRQDKRITGIYIDASKTPQGGGEGFATLKEVRQALAKFKAAGKQVIAYGVDWGEKEYYLSSVANTIVLNPLGGMEINGLASQPMFLSGALDKYGIGVQVVRVGKFKGAVEPFLLKELSPENRQQTQNLLNDVWSEWRQSVGKSRSLPPQKLQAIADTQALLEAPQAKSNGLVDKIAYKDQVIADIKKLTNSKESDKSFKQISISDYAGVNDKFITPKVKSSNKIAIVYAEGEIVDGTGEDEQIGGDRFAKIFRKIRQNKDIKAVVLRINSPGGSATASEIMQREVRLTKKTKPVVVSMGDIAASGGYWIAADSNRIFAEANTITGSIGVFGVLFNAQELANNNGITWDSVKTAKYADTQTVSRPKSPQELAIYQRMVNRIYNLFLTKVAKGRKIPQSKVAEIAQGRVWSGIAAKKIGLVDELGGLEDAINYAAKQANLGKKWQLREYPRVGSFEERLFGIASEEIRTTLGKTAKQNIPNNLLMGELQKLKTEIQILQNMNDPKGIYTRLPFNLRIE